MKKTKKSFWIVWLSRIAFVFVMIGILMLFCDRKKTFIKKEGKKNGQGAEKLPYGEKKIGYFSNGVFMGK